MDTLEQKVRNVFDNVKQDLDSDVRNTSNEKSIVQSIEGDIAPIIQEYQFYFERLSEEVKKLMKENAKMKKYQPQTINCDKRINEKM